MGGCGAQRAKNVYAVQYKCGKLFRWKWSVWLWFGPELSFLCDNHSTRISNLLKAALTHRRPSNRSLNSTQLNSSRTLSFQLELVLRSQRRPSSVLRNQTKDYNFSLNLREHGKIMTVEIMKWFFGAFANAVWCGARIVCVY